MNNQVRTLRFEKYEVDLERRILWVDGDVASLPVKAVELLCALIEQNGGIVSKDELLEVVWQDSFVEEGVLPQNVYLLRRFFEANGSQNLIQTIPRRGYRFVCDLGTPNEVTIEREVIERTIEGRSEYFENVDADAPSLKTETARPNRRWFVAVCVGIGLAVLTLTGAWIVNRREAGIENGHLGSIAVAPFVVVSSNQDPEDNTQKRITEALVFNLRKLRAVFVPDIGATERFFGTGIEPVRLGRELKVEKVLTGSVKDDGTTFRVNFDVVDVASGFSELSDSVEFKRKDGEDPASTAALQIIRRLDIHLSSMIDEKKIPPGLLNQEMKEAYLLAQRIPRENAANRWNESTRLMRSVVEAAPDWGYGHAKLAEAIVLVMSPESCAEARPVAARAIELDPTIAEPFMVRGFCDVTERRWDDAEGNFRKALEINPLHSRAHLELGALLDYRRRFGEAEIHILKAVEQVPLSAFVNFIACQHYYYDRRWDTAERYCKEAVQVLPNYPQAKKQLSWIYAVQKRYDLMYANEFGELNPGELSRNRIASLLAKGDSEGYWNAKIQERLEKTNEKTGPMTFATYYAMLGDKARTLEFLRTAVRENNTLLKYVYADPIWDLVRQEEEYKQMMKEIGLEDGRYTEIPR